MIKLFSKLFDSNEKQIKLIQPIVDKINQLEEYTSGLTSEELKGKTSEFRKKLNIDLENPDFNKETEKQKLLEILPEAFAVVREVAKRETNHRHFDVQLMAGYVLSTNRVAELFTGEGKTNAATLSMYLYGLTGRGAHLVTVNDYLARRDGEWNGHVLSALGMTVGIINSGTQYRFITDEEAIRIKGEEAESAIVERKKLEEQVGRLKLDMMTGVNLLEVSKKEAYECDVVYGTNNEFGFDYLRDNMARRLGDRVQRLLHFAIVDEADSILIDEARTPLIISQSAHASNDLYSQFAKLVTGLKAEADYIVDEKSHSVTITDEGIDQLEKMLKVENIYENAQFAYHLDNALKAMVLYHRDDEYIVRDGEVIIVDEFTGRAMPGRRYSEGLHQAIEAKEGVEVRRESRTLATITLQNYFRLYDYLAGMTGTALTEAEELANIYKLDVVVVPTNREVVREDLNDVVFRTELGKFKAIVEEIKEHHEKGQPMLVGTASVERSEILSEMLKKEGIKHSVLNAKQHEKEARIIQSAGQKGQVTIATNMAGRGTDIALGAAVKDLGGLYVIGSERHESRRIDNQLRGRSGRQGDPGKSRFFVSFEDELMRRFGGDSMKALMGRVGMDDDMPISMGILGRTIENAQKRVESFNYDIRKRLVEYDDVLNQQRDLVYALRKRILEAIENKEELQDPNPKSSKDLQLDNILINKLNLHETLQSLDLFSMQDPDTWDIKELSMFKGVNKPVNHWILKRVINHIRSIIASQLRDDMKIDNTEESNTVAQVKSLLTEEVAEESAKILGYKSASHIFEEFDKIRKITEKEDVLLRLALVAFIYHCTLIGESAMKEFVRALLLQSIDNYWMEHLDVMGDLREGVGMVSIAQKDPLVEYKNEGFRLFEKMFDSIDNAVVSRFFKVKVVKSGPEESRERGVAVHSETAGLLSGMRSRSVDNRPGAVSKQRTVTRQTIKIGRNDLCPCGSGRKYKKCHLDRDPETKEEKDAFALFVTNQAEWNKRYLKKA